MEFNARLPYFGSRGPIGGELHWGRVQIGIHIKLQCSVEHFLTSHGLLPVPQVGLPTNAVPAAWHITGGGGCLVLCFTSSVKATLPIKQYT